MQTSNGIQPAGSSYLLIGAGRLAAHLRHYFSLLGLNCHSWNRKETLDSLKNLLSTKPVVILAISDGALEGFYQTHLMGQNLVVVHCSGTFHSENMISCHPLMTFGKDLYPLETYKKIHFAVTGIENLQQIFPSLPNHSFPLKIQDKALYHALCVLSAAGSQEIWRQSQRLLAGMGVPKDAFKPYIKQIAENYISSGPEALTGPWVRGDQKTISQNLHALASASDKLHKVYEILKEGRYDNP